jgi:hypothetical protein
MLLLELFNKKQHKIQIIIFSYKIYAFVQEFQEFFHETQYSFTYFLCSLKKFA